jgi:hypothetical protein
MKLPNANEAVVDLRKLEEYCLNPDHPRGKHKARVFESALGIGRPDAFELRERILKAVLEERCEPGESDAYGDRYIVDFMWRRNDREARVRTTWVVKIGETAPRLTTCYVL